MSMVAEGYNASKSMFIINKSVKADMPIAEIIYRVLWEGLDVEEAFDKVEPYLV
jgi:glycerol-3-phosphate dehydrogenase (NAD(P)+)